MNLEWIAVAVAAAAIAGCATTTGPSPEPLGRSHRPYPAVPAYLVASPDAPLSPIERYDERVPVAGRSRDDAGPSDELRLGLAAVDARAIAARSTPPPRRLGDLHAAIAEVAGRVRDRADLAAEAVELTRTAQQLEHASRWDSRRLVERLLELTDLIRLQLRAS